MCSIGGIYNPHSAVQESDKYTTLHRIMVRGQQRGRDSWGVCLQHVQGDVCVHKSTNPVNEPIARIHNFRWAMGNNRGEPTTEYVKCKTASDIQPFKGGNWWAVHNGTIANDKKLREHFSFETSTRIDSAVIPEILDMRKVPPYGEEVAQAFDEHFEGSYACAVADERFEKLFLVCNYKPIYLGYNIKYGYYAYASAPESISGMGMEHLSKWSIRKVPPYSVVEFFPSGKVQHHFLRREDYIAPKRSSKAIVVCSGGLDSTVAATWAVRNGFKVELVHFLYDCRAQAKEKQAIINIAKKLGVTYKFIETNIWTTLAKGSRLTDPMAKIAKGEEGIEIAKEWCYARNLVFLSIATAYAESIEAEHIILGNNLEEAGSFPDNEPEFIRKFNELLPNAINANKRLKVLEPVGNKMKHEIVKMGLELEAPLEESWSCYESYDEPCNNCGPCNLKKVAFNINGYILSKDQKSWRRFANE